MSKVFNKPIGEVSASPHTPMPPHLYDYNDLMDAIKIAASCAGQDWLTAQLYLSTIAMGKSLPDELLDWASEIHEAITEETHIESIDESKDQS